MVEVGEYVRTNDGHIGKLIRIERDDIDTYLKWYVFDDGKNERYVNKPYIVNHSKNIIDLLEVGDYVNGNEVLDKYLFNGEKPVLETTGDETNAKCVCEGDIRTILTKELYKANCYTVERKE